MTVYRLASIRHPANDGLEASIFGGRWNRKGTPVIYAAASRALCALEILANAGALADDYAVIRIELPDDISTTTLPVESLPASWSTPEPTTATADIGTRWAGTFELPSLSSPPL